MKNLGITLLIVLSTFNLSLAQNSGNIEKGNYKLKAVAELRFLGALSHKIQFGYNGTYFGSVALILTQLNLSNFV